MKQLQNVRVLQPCARRRSCISLYTPHSYTDACSEVIFNYCISSVECNKVVYKCFFGMFEFLMKYYKYRSTCIFTPFLKITILLHVPVISCNKAVTLLQMGCMYETCLRLMNSRFCVIWAWMIYYETRLMVLLQQVDSKLVRMASWLKNFD